MPKEILDPKLPLTFGKFKSGTPEQLLSFSPSYLGWLVERTNYTFPPEFLVKVKTQMEALAEKKLMKSLSYTRTKRSRRSYGGEIDDIDYEGRGHYDSDMC